MRTYLSLLRCRVEYTGEAVELTVEWADPNRMEALHSGLPACCNVKGELSEGAYARRSVVAFGFYERLPDAAYHRYKLRPSLNRTDKPLSEMREWNRNH